LKQEPFDREIVGVAEDSRYYPLGADEGEVSYLFLPSFQRSSNSNLILQVRTSSAPLSFVPALRQILTNVEPDAALYNVHTLDGQVSDGLEPMRMAAQQIGAVSVLGVALALAGIFASGAYRVAQQKQEIAIRIAIGASAASVIRTFTARGLWVGVAGAALGLAPALWGARLLRASVPGAGVPGSPLLAMAGAALVCAAAMSALAAASRISRVQPADVLRVQ
jgi:ABC-type antimicrobial peptide transport system permease subunit